MFKKTFLLALLGAGLLADAAVIEPRQFGSSRRAIGNVAGDGNSGRNRRSFNRDRDRRPVDSGNNRNSRNSGGENKNDNDNDNEGNTGGNAGDQDASLCLLENAIQLASTSSGQDPENPNPEQSDSAT